MTRKKLHKADLMKATEELLLEQGYGGFHFSALSLLLGIGRSTLYEYYDSKDDLIVAYMNELMEDYTGELEAIASQENAKMQLLNLIELMIKYAHIHNILKIIPLLKSNSHAVIEMKENFITEHVHIIKKIETIIDNGKLQNVIREEIPTDILVNLLFNTINKPSSFNIDNKAWAKWIWEIIYTGMKV